MCTKRKCKKLRICTWKIITQIKSIKLTVEKKINTRNIYDLNQRDDGLAWKLEFLMYMNLSTFLALKNPVLNFLNFLRIRALLSYEKRSTQRDPIATNDRWIFQPVQETDTAKTYEYQSSGLAWLISLRHSYNYHIIWHFHRGSWITWIAIRRIKQLRKHRILLVQSKEGSSKLLNYTVWLPYEYRATRNCEWSDKRIEIQCKDAIIKSQNYVWKIRNAMSLITPIKIVSVVSNANLSIASPLKQIMA